MGAHTREDFEMSVIEGTLKYYLLMANKNTSFPEETAENWESWVCRPVITHMIAPRHARASLELIGKIVDSGQNLERVFEVLCLEFNIQ